MRPPMLLNIVSGVDATRRPELRLTTDGTSRGLGRLEVVGAGNQRNRPPPRTADPFGRTAVEEPLCTPPGWNLESPRERTSGSPWRHPSDRRSCRPSSARSTFSRLRTARAGAPRLSRERGIRGDRLSAIRMARPTARATITLSRSHPPSTASSTVPQTGIYPCSHGQTARSDLPP